MVAETGHPAELGSIVAGVLAIAVAFGVKLDATQTAAILGFVALVPGIVTFVVSYRRTKVARP